MPAPGWTGDYDWTGYLRFHSLPQLADPSAGWIATANNDIRPPDYAHFISARWEPPYRYHRIADLIEEMASHTPETLAAMQLDIRSDAAQEVLSSLLEAIPEDTEPSAAVELLRTWDFRMARDRPEPLIFTAWLAALNDAILRDELGTLFDGFGLAMAPDSAWCDDIGTPGPEDCGTQIRAAWTHAIEELTSAYGGEPRNWRWGDAHRARFSHPLFDRIPVLRDVLSTAIETDGDNFTVNRATPRLDFETVVFPDVHAAGLRAVFDLADLDASLFIIAGGQSGNPLSTHYADFVESWRDGRYIRLNGGGAEILTLVPSRR
jgi:penicillin amidase